MPPTDTAKPGLARVVGIPGAVLMGLGSILGTGIFVSVGVAAGIAGPSVLLAVVLAALVATFNGLASAQLAAAHPVSGGSYEYGYRLLDPRLGFTAGWMFLCAKSASAATAALGLAGYLLSSLGLSDDRLQVGVAAGVVLVLTLVIAGGMQRSSRVNAAIVSSTLLALASFVAFGLRGAITRGQLRWPEILASAADTPALLQATALMFVAYTGYGRIATLGEEIRDPSRNIPRAIIITLIATMVIYVSVAVVAIGTLGADAAASSDAPLELAANQFSPTVARIVALGAITALTGVILNLLLGLSRVLLAMARRSDMPQALAQVTSEHGSPRRAVLAIGALVAGLTLIGSVQITWSFSAFTVLVYYAITNLAALRLPAAERRYPRGVAVAGLVACLGLAFWVEPRIWMAGLAVIAVGLIWHAVARRSR